MSELSVNLNARSKRAAPAVPIEDSGEGQLMARLSQGDESAMRELLDCHGLMLTRLVGRLTAWHTDRDDILQEVLLTAWRQAGSFQGKGSLAGWLRRIAVNRCRNHYRSVDAVRRMIEGFRWTQQAQLNGGYITASEDHEVSQLRSAMAKLKQADRTVLVLYYLEEMPAGEVAATIGIKQETLHVRMHRARQRLKKILVEEFRE